MHSWRPVIRQRWVAAVIKQHPFHRNLSESWPHTSSPLSTGDQLLTCGGSTVSFSYTHTCTPKDAQQLENGGIRRKKHKKREKKTIWSGLFGANKSGEFIWLPELGCHVELGPKLAVVNWPQLICSLNTAFCLITPVFEMVLDVFSGFFPR